VLFGTSSTASRASRKLGLVALLAGHLHTVNISEVALIAPAGCRILSKTAHRTRLGLLSLPGALAIAFTVAALLAFAGTFAIAFTVAALYAFAGAFAIAITVAAFFFGTGLRALAFAFVRVILFPTAPGNEQDAEKQHSQTCQMSHSINSLNFEKQIGYRLNIGL